MPLQPTFARFNDLAGTTVRINVVDIGANPVNGPAPYAAMLQNGDADVVGFEPHPQALAQLNEIKGPRETYLPHAVGDGRTHTLNLCAAPCMSSLLEPNPDILNRYHGFPLWGTVTGTMPVDTVRLDDVAETAEMDMLKIDIQGAELMVFQNAEARLAHTLLIQTEVEFLPMYKDQPLFSDVDQFLRRHGFVLHRFIDMDSRILSPMILSNNIYKGLSQHLFADAIFIKDFTRADRFETPQLLKLAAILHDCYGSIDLVMHLLGEYDRRSGTALAGTYLAGLQQDKAAA